MAIEKINNKLKAIIVDDERPARKELELLLKKYPEIQIVGEGGSINEAQELIVQTKPDIVFLDIELANENGFDLLPKINSEIQVIFVTAFDEYALRAFEVNSLDYLLKPVNPVRLQICIDRIKKNVQPIVEVPLKYDDSIFISDRNNSMFLKIKNIAAIQSNGDYSVIWSIDNNKYTVLSSLKNWEKRLPANDFKRIHKTSIVNINYIENIHKGFNNNHQVRLKNMNLEIEMSRRFFSSFKTNFR